MSNEKFKAITTRAELEKRANNNVIELLAKGDFNGIKELVKQGKLDSEKADFVCGLLTKGRQATIQQNLAR